MIQVESHSSQGPKSLKRWHALHFQFQQEAPTLLTKFNPSAGHRFNEFYRELLYPFQSAISTDSEFDGQLPCHGSEKLSLIVGRRQKRIENADETNDDNVDEF